MSDDSLSRCTERQGQFLTFIHLYTLLNGRLPAEDDMQCFFRVTGPVVHQMVLALERNGLISRMPGMARSIQLLISAAQLPELHPANQQPVRSRRMHRFVV